MPIPKKIYQVWHDKNKLPPFYKKYNDLLKQTLIDYEFFLFDESEMDNFVRENYPGIITNCFNKINIITAKVDFWRYLFLYKNGGIYLDIDSMILKPIDDLILNCDAVITREPNFPYTYVQWALFFCKDHPILKEVINLIVDNIIYNKYPNNVIKMTGPYVYTDGIEVINKLTGNNIDRTNNNLWSLNPNNVQTPDVLFLYNGFNYRVYGIQYGSYCLSWVPEKNEMYSEKNEHWSAEKKPLLLD